jgi:hypothetical protein
MRTVTYWVGLIVLFTLMMKCSGCGGKKRPAAQSTLDKIASYMPRVEEQVDPRLYLFSGDATIFNGLLSGDFEWACDYLKQSQFEDGSFARSPLHYGMGERDFSRDGAIGVLWAVKKGCLVEEVGEFVKFINSHDGCLSLKCDDKAKTSGPFRALIQKVTGLNVTGAWVASSWVPTFQSYFNEGSDEFLDYASISLYGNTRAAKNLNHPFQQIVAGDKAAAAESLLKYLLTWDGYPTYKGDTEYLRWSMQWGMDYPMRPEEIVWLYNQIRR